MTFLKQLGLDILKGAAIVAGFAPLAEAAMPGQAAKIQTVSNDISQIADLVAIAETFGQAATIPGPQRAQFIAAQVAQVLLKSAAFAGKKIADPIAFQAGAQTIAGGVAQCLNAVDAGEVKTQNVT